MSTNANKGDTGVQASGEQQEKVVVPMGASKNPKYRYQSRAAQTLREVCEVSRLTSSEIATLLQSTTGRAVSADEIESWQAGETDFPAWIIPAVADVGGAKLERGPWAIRRRHSLGRVSRTLVTLLAGGLLALAVSSHLPARSDANSLGVAANSGSIATPTPTPPWAATTAATPPASPAARPTAGGGQGGHTAGPSGDAQAATSGSLLPAPARLVKPPTPTPTPRSHRWSPSPPPRTPTPRRSPQASPPPANASPSASPQPVSSANPSPSPTVPAASPLPGGNILGGLLGRALGLLGL
jgi:hypothetical protein